MSNEHYETRQERRARKLQKRRERMQQHGKGMAQLYKDTVLKKLHKTPDDGKKT